MDSTPADNPVFRKQYDQYLKTVEDPSRAYSFEEFSKIDNLKKQYLADPKNFKFDTYASGRRTFPATMPGKTELPIAEKIKRVLSEEEKRTVKQLSSAVKSTPMETPYGKSFLSYTPEGKIAGKAGSVLRGLGRVAGPLGAALTALDLAQGLGEVQEKGAAKIAEDYKKEEDKKAKMVNFIEESPNAEYYKKAKMVNFIEESPNAKDYKNKELMSPEYSPEERAKLKEILSKYKANAALRSER